MPFVAVGLYIAFAVFFGIHAMRTGQPMYWLFILFTFPLLGSVVYFFAIYLPTSRLEQGARKAVAAAVRVMDPTRAVREARGAFEDTPTAQNQMRLAAALLAAGDAKESARQYQACLNGPFASDPEIRLGAAGALVECQQYVQALGYLEPLRRELPGFRPEVVSLLLARSLAGASRADEARAEFESGLARFGTFEAAAEYAIWAYAIGDTATVERLHEQLEKISAKWNRLNRELNAPVSRRLMAAKALAAKKS